MLSGAHDDQQRSSSQERKTNTHSEQKRRQTLRDKFKELSNLVPELADKPLKSEATVLLSTVTYMNTLLRENARMKAYLKKISQERGIPCEEAEIDSDEEYLMRHTSSTS